MTVVVLFLLEGPVIYYIGVMAAIWLIVSILNDFFGKIKIKKGSFNLKLNKVFSIPISTYGMYMAHIGLAVFILGVAVSDSKKIYYEGVMTEKQTIKLDQFVIKLSEVLEDRQKNWISQTGKFIIDGFNKNIEMFAERRIYLDTGMPSTEAAIFRNFFSHLYI